MTIDEVLNRLKKGNQRFCRDQMSREKQDSHRRLETIDGQNPFAIILTCADSRVIPELIFDTGIGELFVVRVAGNIANKSTIASIEYAVANLNAAIIMVLAHENCGAVSATIQDGDYGENLEHLVDHIRPAIHEAPINEVAKKNAMITVEQLLKNSIIISGSVNKKQLQVLPAYYHLGSGEVEYL